MVRELVEALAFQGRKDSVSTGLRVENQVLEPAG